MWGGAGGLVDTGSGLWVCRSSNVVAKVRFGGCGTVACPTQLRKSESVVSHRHWRCRLDAPGVAWLGRAWSGCGPGAGRRRGPWRELGRYAAALARSAVVLGQHPETMHVDTIGTDPTGSCSDPTMGAFQQETDFVQCLRRAGVAYQCFGLNALHARLEKPATYSRRCR